MNEATIVIMKNRFFLLIIVSITISNQFLFSQRRITTYISPHSPTNDLARYLSGWSLFINNQDTKTNYGPFAIIPQLSKSFRAERVNQCLFGDQVLDSKTTLTISGSYIMNRQPCDWLAENFLLPRDYISTIHTRPNVTSFSIDFMWYYGIDQFMPGFYITLQAPLVHTQWDINWCEVRPHPGTIGYDAGFLSSSNQSPQELFPHATAFFTGHTLPLVDASTQAEPLRYSKISLNPLKKLHIAEIQMMLGYNFWANYKSNFGFFLLIEAPMGNRPKGIYLFEPIIGNGHLWQLGLGSSAHGVFWECEETNEQAGIYAAVSIGHLFSTDQQRIFDLKCSQQSRYLLAAQVNSPVIDGLQAEKNGVIFLPDAQFKQQVAPVANLTASKVKVKNNWQVDSALMLSYTKNCFTWDLGYGFFARSKDQIKRGKSRLDTTTVRWAIKGDAQLYGFADTHPVPLSMSESQATIYSGTNALFLDNNQINGTQNNGIDNPQLAFASPVGIVMPLAIQPATTTQINTSIQPILLTPYNIDINSAKTRIYTSKIFGQISRYWFHNEQVISYIGFGAEVQLGPRPDHGPVNRRARSVNTGLTAWNIWLKGGVDWGK